MLWKPVAQLYLCLVVPLAVPTWLRKPQDSQLEEGKPGYLHCLTRATPKPTVIWYRNQMLISEVRKDGSLVDGRVPQSLLSVHSPRPLSALSLPSGR